MIHPPVRATSPTASWWAQRMQGHRRRLRRGDRPGRRCAAIRRVPMGPRDRRVRRVSRVGQPTPPRLEAPAIADLPALAILRPCLHTGPMDTDDGDAFIPEPGPSDRVRGQTIRPTGEQRRGPRSRTASALPPDPSGLMGKDLSDDGWPRPIAASTSGSFSLGPDWSRPPLTPAHASWLNRGLLNHAFDGRSPSAVTSADTCMTPRSGRAARGSISSTTWRSVPAARRNAHPRRGGSGRPEPARPGRASRGRRSGSSPA
jgi:hypothetical protein